MDGERAWVRPGNDDPAQPPGPDGGDRTTACVTGTDERSVAVTGDGAEDLLELLGDDYTQRILETLEGEPIPARAVIAACDTSRPTVYRRLNRLQEYDLVGVDTELHPDGHHRKVFAKRFERATVELKDGTPEILLVIRDEGTEHDDARVELPAD